MRKKITLYALFFKSTLTISLPVALLFCAYGATTSGLSNGLFSFMLLYFLFIPLGLVFDLIYKEMTQKEQYYFYYNQGISKIHLWIMALLFSFIPYVVVKLIQYIIYV